LLHGRLAPIRDASARAASSHERLAASLHDRSRRFLTRALGRFLQAIAAPRGVARVTSSQGKPRHARGNKLASRTDRLRPLTSFFRRVVCLEFIADHAPEKAHVRTRRPFEARR
jgi:hypothetical protein